METMKPDLPDDDTTLSQAYQALPKPEPSAALDAAILAAAREAVQPSAQVIAFPKRRRNWSVPLGLAASLVIAVGLGYQLQQSGEGRLDNSEAKVVVPGPTSPAPAAAAPALPKADQITPPAELQTDAQATPPAPSQAAATARREVMAEAKQRAKEPQPAASPAPQAAPEVAMPAPAPAAPPAPPPPPAFAAPPSAPSALLEQPPAAKPAAPATAGRAADSASVTVTGSAIKRMTTASPAPEPAAAPQERAKVSEEGRLQLRQNLAAPAPKAEQPALDAERTLQEVRRLQAAGQDDAARTLLQRLKAQQPDYPIPAELHSLLITPPREP
ncbi:hypothetical protein [Chitinimonas sp.]|uniref:hypothetical protein n=1 Tax=Chitinimonas sp. TaxID=1934313 RepID=UPI002F9373E1